MLRSAKMLILLFAVTQTMLRAADEKPAESKRLLNDNPLPVVAAPIFKEPLDAAWSVAKGTWTPENGELKAVELPAEKHVAVLHHKVGLASAVIDCEFRMDTPGVFYIGCDSTKHVGRVVIGPEFMQIAEDSAPKSNTLAKITPHVKVGEWHRLHVEWKGDQMAAILDGQELRAKHDYLATPKARSWIAVGKTATVRNLTIAGEKTPEK